MPKPCGNPFERAQGNKDFKKGSKWEWMMIERISLSVNPDPKKETVKNELSLS